MITERSLYSSAPPDSDVRQHNNPTLLFSWWCSGCAVVVILFRLCGRKVRNGVLFREDRIMALSLIPLLIRMGFIHPVLLWGTNNAAETDLMSDEEIHRRAIASRLVLGARVFYAIFIWTAKLTICEFLQRLTASMWKRSYEITVQAIRIFLAATFVAVFIATLAECHPITHYWQVVPDPGPQCRQGYAQLITMGATDITTDALLIFFPIPVVLQSNFHWTRKVSLVLLFSLSAIPLAIAAYRIPAIIEHKSIQQFRTVWASGEILAAAAVSNAIILGSFLRDRGVKKAKYKPHRFNSATESTAPSSRRQTFSQRQFGSSDEDLFRDMCYRTATESDVEGSMPPRSARTFAPISSGASDMSPLKKGVDSWKFPESSQDESSRGSRGSRGSDDTDLKDEISIDPMPSPGDVRGVPPYRRVSFVDAGGLLGDSDARSAMSAISPTSSTVVQDFASSRRSSKPFLSPSSSQRSDSDLTMTNPLYRPSNRTEPPRSILRRHNSNRPSLQLQDVGGLLPPRDAGDSIELRDVGGLLPPNTAGDSLGLQDVGGLLAPPPRQRVDSHQTLTAIPIHPTPHNAPTSPPPTSPHFHLPRPHLPRSLSRTSEASRSNSYNDSNETTSAPPNSESSPANRTPSSRR